MTSLLSRGEKTVKVSAISGKWFWSYSNRQQEDLYSDCTEKNYRRSLINHNYRVQWVTELGLVPFYSP